MSPLRHSLTHSHTTRAQSTRKHTKQMMCRRSFAQCSRMYYSSYIQTHTHRIRLNLINCLTSLILLLSRFNGFSLWPRKVCSSCVRIRGAHKNSVNPAKAYYSRKRQPAITNKIHRESRHTHTAYRTSRLPSPRCRRRRHTHQLWHAPRAHFTVLLWRNEQE